MKYFVLDCSITMAWFLPDESSDYSQTIKKQLREEEIIACVPAIWAYEVSNVLHISIRRKRTILQRARIFQQTLYEALPIEIDNHNLQESTKECFRLANTFNISAYDAAYLELACRKNFPIATLDQAMRKAAEKLGIELFHGEAVL